MIQIVTGKLGAGKTLYTVMLLFDALCQGRTVVTNIQVEFDELAKLARLVRRVHISPEQLIRLDPGADKNWQESIPFGVRMAFVEVFLDEIHLFFNARDWAETNKNNRGLLSFLTQSRKAMVNVTFIAQEITTIEKQFRVLAEWELSIIPSSHLPLGILGKLPWKFFIVSKKDALNQNVVSRIYRGYDKRYFRLYGSFSFLDEEMKRLAGKAKVAQPTPLPRVGLFAWLRESFVEWSVGMLQTLKLRKA